MRTSAVVTALLVLVAGSAPSRCALAKKRNVKSAALDASSCAEFSQSTDLRGRAITFAFDNRCAQPVRCAVSWKVSCPDDSGAGGAHEESIDLDAKARHTVEASASACGDGSWKISPAEWTCHFAPDPGNTAQR